MAGRAAAGAGALLLLLLLLGVATVEARLPVDTAAVVALNSAGANVNVTWSSDICFDCLFVLVANNGTVNTTAPSLLLLDATYGLTLRFIWADGTSGGDSAPLHLQLVDQGEYALSIALQNGVLVGSVTTLSEPAQSPYYPIGVAAAVLLSLAVAWVLVQRVYRCSRTVGAAFRALRPGPRRTPRAQEDGKPRAEVEEPSDATYEEQRAQRLLPQVSALTVVRVTLDVRVHSRAGAGCGRGGPSGQQEEGALDFSGCVPWHVAHHHDLRELQRRCERRACRARSAGPRSAVVVGAQATITSSTTACGTG